MRGLMVFDSITMPVPKDRVYKRLGYQRDKTRLSSLQRIEIEQYIEESVSFIKLSGAVKRLAIKEKNAFAIVFGQEGIFESKHAAALLKDCDEALFMGVTAGQDIIEQIQTNSSIGNLTKAVVFDAAAGEITDAALDWLMNYINQQLRRENKVLTRRRVSAGYSDFILENQRILYSALELNKLGVKITSDCILTPEKSVTAVAGILDRGQKTGVRRQRIEVSAC